MNKRGLALFMVLGVIMLVILAANTVLNVILNQTRLTHHVSSRIQAYYAAKGAMYYTLEQLRLGAWGAGSHPFCRSGCSGAGGVDDPDLPACINRINVTVGAAGTAINGTQLVNITTDFTY